MKINECREIILEAGKRLLEAHSFSIREKTDFKNLVTTCDVQVQSFLTDRLSRLFPEATFLCEENDVHDTTGSLTFIIDPIDGTSNFIHHYHISAISVALADASDLLWGIVYNPFSGELYEAERGRGAFWNGEPIHVSSHDLAHCLVGFGTSPYNRALAAQTFALAAKTLPLCVDLRRSGAASLDHCFTARGSYGLFFELEEQAWDYAAGMCIVQEAGGTVVNFDGQVPDFTKKSNIIAGSPRNVEAFFSKVLGK